LSMRWRVPAAPQSRPRLASSARQLVAQAGHRPARRRHHGVVTSHKAGVGYIPGYWIRSTTVSSELLVPADYDTSGVEYLSFSEVGAHCSRRPTRNKLLTIDSCFGKRSPAPFYASGQWYTIWERPTLRSPHPHGISTDAYEMALRNRKTAVLPIQR